MALWLLQVRAVELQAQRIENAVRNSFMLNSNEEAEHQSNSARKKTKLQKAPAGAALR
jgi:hypothetical protein